MPAASRAINAPTLPDLLVDGLDVVFVGINPSIYSAERGRYFARPGNRFWPCLSRSRLSEPARHGLGVELLGPEHDRLLQQYGIGFTDVVKRPTVKAGDLTTAELAGGVSVLLEKIALYKPRIVCFHGITGYRAVHDLLIGKATPIELGLQTLQLEATRVFLVPNPSGANAHFTRDDHVRWYDALHAALVGGTRPSLTAASTAVPAK